MGQQSLVLGGSGLTDTDTKSKEYWDGYQAGITSCNHWQDYHNPHPKNSEEEYQYHMGYANALDDLVHAWGSTGC